MDCTQLLLGPKGEQTVVPRQSARLHASQAGVAADPVRQLQP